MRIEPTPIAGVFVVHAEPVVDARGHFARLWCAETFARHGLVDRFDQCSLSSNPRRGTLRGLHWQEAPFAETKLVRVTRGAAFDVAVDLRPGSPTRLRWFAAELRDDALTAMLLPPGVAHGFQTLTDATDVLYQIAGRHVPDAARGARWDDPALGIDWPLPVAVLSERDAGWPSVDGHRAQAGVPT